MLQLFDFKVIVGGVSIMFYYVVFAHRVTSSCQQSGARDVFLKELVIRPVNIGRKRRFAQHFVYVSTDLLECFIIFHFYFLGASRNRFKVRWLLNNDLSSLELSPDLLINLWGSTMVWPLVDFLNITITRTEIINLVNFFSVSIQFYTISKAKKTFLIS